MENKIGTKINLTLTFRTDKSTEDLETIRQYTKAWQELLAKEWEAEVVGVEGVNVEVKCME